jgi:molybdenum cofactor synthesis domain-containing protein
MKKIRVEDAVGTVLAHDMTRIIPGSFKGVGFKKGRIIREDDIPELLKIGKKHLYVLDLSEDQVHEDDAALRIAELICGDHLRWTEPREGKTKITSTIDGLFELDVDALLGINSSGDTIVSTIKTHFPCTKGQVVACTRIIPLIIERERIERLADTVCAGGPVLNVLPYTRRMVGLVVTGSEVFEGLVTDESDRFIVSKLGEYRARLVRKIVTPDDAARIAEAVRELYDEGCEVIITSGGLSVDPDDVTREGVRASGAEIVSYGSPVLPGAMFLNARLGEVPIVGLPAGVFFSPRTIYDLMLPRVLADLPPTAAEIAAMGHGGLCMECEVCHFPVCPFGR